MSRAIALCLLLLTTGELRAGDDRLPPGAILRLGDCRFRAGGPVIDLVFSPDGTELISRVLTTDSECLTTWDTATGTASRTSTKARAGGTLVRWANATIPDSPRGLVIGPDGVARVRDFEAN